MLIEAIKTESVIYDVTSLSYRNNLKKEDAWKRIAETVGKSENINSSSESDSESMLVKIIKYFAVLGY